MFEYISAQEAAKSGVFQKDECGAMCRKPNI